MTVGLYLRISHDPLALRAGVERQSTDCHTISGQRWPNEPIRVFEDNDKSAYRGKRPQFTALSNSIQSGEITAVVGWDLDRMFRQPRELEAFIDLCDTHHMTRVITAKGDLDLTTHDGQLHARILVAVARKSSDDASRRVRRAALDRAETGKWHGGTTPFGYTRDAGQLCPDPAAAPHVLTAAQMISRGEPLRAILRNGHGPTSTSGWRHLLQSPTVAGYTRLHADANWPAIIPRDLWLQVQTILEQRRTGTRPHTIHWLTGILVCEKCQGMIEAHTADKYMCRENSCAAINRVSAEHVISEMMFEAARIIPPAAPTSPSSPLASSPRLTELAVDYANGRITRDEWLAVRESLIQPASLPVASPAIPVELEALWHGPPPMTTAERHHMAGRLLIRVELSPALRQTHADAASRLHPVWR